MEVGLVGSGGLLRGDLSVAEFDAGKDEDGSDEAGGDGAERIEGLREVEAALTGAGWAELGDEGVGAGLKKGEAAGNDELRDKEEGVEAGLRGGIEHPAAGAEEDEAGDNAGFVTEAAHELRGGDGEREVAEVEPDLDAGGAGAVEVERLHELADENVVEVVGNGPKKEEHGDDEERQEASGGNERGFNVFAAGRGLRADGASRDAQSGISSSVCILRIEKAILSNSQCKNN